MNESIKNFSYLTVGKIIGSALQALFYIILALILHPNVYGELSFLISLASTTAIIARFGLSQTVVVFRAKNDEEMVNQSNMLALIGTSIAAIILIPINLLSALLCFSLTFFVMQLQNLLGSRKYKEFFLQSVIRSVLILVIPILFYFVLDIQGVMIGLSISYLTSSINFIKLLKSKINSFSEIRKNNRIIIHNFGVEASQSLPRWVDKLIIVPFFGYLNAGLYQFNTQILFAFVLLPISLHSFLLAEESSGKNHRRIIKYVVISSIVLTIITILSSDYIIHHLFSNYVDGIQSLQILILSLVPISLTSVFNAKLQARGSVNIGFAGFIRIFSLMILLMILGNLQGLNGLSLAFLISAIIETIISFLLLRNKRKQVEI